MIPPISEREGTIRGLPLRGLPLRGFYAVLDRDDEELAWRLARAARMLQIRLKTADVATVLAVARMARRICDATGTKLIVNDRVDIALAANADGVHLGQTDLPVVEAHAIAQGRLVIGVSTHDLAQVRAACAAGADYLGYGPVFATATKVNPDPVQGLEALRRAVEAAGEIPVVAIGGITPERAADVYATGAAAICAIGAVNAAADPAAVAARFAHCQ